MRSGHADAGRLRQGRQELPAGHAQAATQYGAVHAQPQVPGGPQQETFPSRERRRHGTEGQQGVGPRLFHLCLLLGAVFRPQHLVRRVSRLSRAYARGRHVSLAGLRVQHHQPRHLHSVQQDVPRGLHSSVEVPVSSVRETFQVPLGHGESTLECGAQCDVLRSRRGHLGPAALAVPAGDSIADAEFYGLLVRHAHTCWDVPWRRRLQGRGRPRVLSLSVSPKTLRSSIVL